MIEQFWPALGVTVLIVISLIGAFWKLARHADETQKRYSLDISAMEAKIRSSQMLPEIIKLIQEVVSDKKTDPKASLEKILSEEKYLQFIRNITKCENEIMEIKNSYKLLKATISGLSRGMLYLALLISPLIAVFYFSNTQYVSAENLNVVCLILAFATPYFVLFSVVPKVLKYLSASKDLSSKYDEVIMGISSNNSE